AVSAVSGEQILKAIVDAAAGGGEKAGKKAEAATNPIEAAIGSTDEQNAAAAFKNNGMTKDDQIAAAMVLRGMAQGGQFALTSGDHANAKGTVKNVVESAVTKTVGALTNLVRKTVQAGLKKVGDVVKADSSKEAPSSASDK
uniref:variable large family protein n=1 Tax=Borreliella valaisiana TaxID=62088 RepID=UPI001AEF65D4